MSRKEKCTDKEWQHCREEKMGCGGCYYNNKTISLQDIEQAKSNLLRCNDIEAASLIMEEVIFHNLILVGGRVNIIKIAMRQIINFIERYKNKGYIEIIKEKVKLKEQNNKLEIKMNKVKDKIEELEEEDKYGGKTYSSTDVVCMLQKILK